MIDLLVERYPGKQAAMHLGPQERPNGLSQEQNQQESFWTKNNCMMNAAKLQLIVYCSKWLVAAKCRRETNISKLFNFFLILVEGFRELRHSVWKFEHVVFTVRHSGGILIVYTCWKWYLQAYKQSHWKCRPDLAPSGTTILCGVMLCGTVRHCLAVLWCGSIIDCSLVIRNLIIWCSRLCQSIFEWVVFYLAYM